MRTDLPSGTVTFLFTDIEGSTRLLHTLGPDAYSDALAEHRRVLREEFAAHEGVEVDTQGDAFFVAFPTAEGAAAAAVAAGEALASGPISVRMGLHTGAPRVTAEGYVGIDVHRGARVAALAHGGQIVLSPATAALLEGHELRDLGVHRLKDFEGGTRLAQLGAGEFPPLRSPGSVDLPTPATRFLGREHELFEAVSLVYDRDPRMLTILGPGGTGKTRFALELCRLLAEDADGGTVFCPLAPLREPELVLTTIAERLGAGSADAASIAARVGDKRTHVLVDNVEHLLPHAASPLALLVEAAPSLRLVVTSREALRVRSEVELDLPPLAEREAVDLFVARAQAVRPDLEEDEAIRALCARLDRLPLALELAAARTKLLSPDALLERLGASFDLLKGARDVDERHATLRATIAWSYDLLSEDEQGLFGRLAVFRGGCTLESAERVCDADLDTLASLLDKSLVRRRTGRLGEERFWMLETIGEFAREKLTESGEDRELQRRHAERMLEIGRAANLSEDDDEPFDLSVALDERDDVRAALDWAAEADTVLGLELACALESFWGPHAPAEGMRRFDKLLEGDIEIPPLLRARALRNLAGAAHQERNWAVSDPAYEESLRIFTTLGDRRGMSSIRTRLAYRAAGDGDRDRALQLLKESQADAEGRFLLIETQNAMLVTHMAVAEGRMDDARASIEVSSELARRLSWPWHDAIIRTSRMEIALHFGELDEAERQGALASAINLEYEHSATTVVATLTGLARLALRRGDLERAGLLWGAVLRHGETLLGPRFRERAAELDEEDDPIFGSAIARGRELDLRDAVELAATSQTVP